MEDAGKKVARKARHLVNLNLEIMVCIGGLHGHAKRFVRKDVEGCAGTL